jgi:hypothetical protein
MNVESYLKTENALLKLDNFLELINKSSTPCLKNPSFTFDPDEYLFDIMNKRTDSLAEFSSFSSFNELLYPSFSNQTKNHKTEVILKFKTSNNVQFSMNQKIFDNEDFEHFANENEKCKDLVNLPLSDVSFLEINQKYSKKEFYDELQKFDFKFKALDLIYFFDLMLLKNSRFYIKEHIVRMFYDNIFIHNQGKLYSNT